MDCDDVFLQESTATTTDNEEDGLAVAGSKKRKRSQGSKEVFTENLSILLDRCCNISDRNVVRIVFATAEALGCNVDKLTLSRSTIRDRRITFRSQRTQKIRDRFTNSDLQSSVVHWDGKLLLLQKDNVSVKRLAILVSKGNEEHLLGVLELKSSTGVSQAEAVSDSLKEWGEAENIVGMCFDTTASNT